MNGEYKIGELVEAGPLMANLSVEDVILQAVKVVKGAESTKVFFDATYFGAHLGKVTFMDGKWEWVK